MVLKPAGQTPFGPALSELFCRPASPTASSTFALARRRAALAAHPGCHPAAFTGSTEVGRPRTPGGRHPKRQGDAGAPAASPQHRPSDADPEVAIAGAANACDLQPRPSAKIAGSRPFVEDGSGSGRPGAGRPRQKISALDRAWMKTRMGPLVSGRAAVARPGLPAERPRRGAKVKAATGGARHGTTGYCCPAHRPVDQT